VQELRLIRDEWSEIHERHPSKDIDLSIIDEFLSMNKLERYYIRPKKTSIEINFYGKAFHERCHGWWYLQSCYYNGVKWECHYKEVHVGLNAYDR